MNSTNKIEKIANFSRKLGKLAIQIKDGLLHKLEKFLNQKNF